jgi:hypothetical protein
MTHGRWDGQGDDGLALTAAAARRLEAISGKEWKAGPGETYVLHLVYAGRTGMCGNGICEVRTLRLVDFGTMAITGKMFFR